MMFTDFQIRPMPLERFAALLAADDDTLSAQSARWVIADAKPSFPCRVSLEDAEIGEEVLLLHHVFHDTDSPYRASGPIYVRRSAAEATLDRGEIPPIVGTRRISLRAYRSDGMLVDADVIDGQNFRSGLEALAERSDPTYVDVHNAATGCFFCRVEEIGTGQLTPPLRDRVLA